MKFSSLKRNKLVKHLVRDISNNADWLQFLLIFSRMEYALKQSGFYIPRRYRTPKVSSWHIPRLTGNDNPGHIEASWTKFGKAIESDFYHNTPNEVRAAIRYVSEHPPHIQYETERKEIDWRPFLPNNRNDIVAIIGCIKTVRNNLFHGAKYPTIPNPDPSRDIELTKNCVTLLKYILTLNRDVEEYYYKALE